MRELKDTKNITVVKSLYVGRFCEIDKFYHNNNPKQFYARKRINKDKFLRATKIKSEEFDKNMLILQRTLHPNIIKHLSCNQEADKKFYTVFMDYYEKGSVQDIINITNKPIATSLIMNWMPKILSALYFFHERCFSHRNLRVSSFLITSNNDVILSGFGKHVSGYQFTHDIMRTTIFNDIIYQAPEMNTICAGVWPYNAQQTDLWAIGVCLFIMLNVDPPFSAQLYQQDPLEFFQNQRNSKYSFRPEYCKPENDSLRQLCRYFMEPIASRRISALQALTHSSLFQQ